MATIDKKYLEGLSFHYSQSKDVEGEGGVMRKVYTPMKRNLTSADVLAVRETDSEVVFVAADGQRSEKKQRKPRKGVIYGS